MANIPHRSGCSCLILIATFLQLAPAQNRGSELEPSLSITFNICLCGTFNLFYSTTPLDSTDLPDPSESNEMATLMSVSMLTGRTNHPVGLFKKKKKKKTRSKEEGGFNSVGSCSDFQRELLSSPAVPDCSTVPSLIGMCDWFVTHGIHH